MLVQTRTRDGRPTTGKTVAILQSDYIPWKGYFELIDSVDEVILYDDAQFTRRDWRNRNLIKTREGLKWLTIPVAVKHKYRQAISETVVIDHAWSRKHFETLRHSYARAEYFSQYRNWLEDLYGCCEGMTSLSEINHLFLTAICRRLGITTAISWSSRFELVPGRTERLIGICRQAGATTYVSGPSARGYMDASLWDEAGIELSYHSYEAYPEYKQLFAPFEHRVSTLDVVLNMGPYAQRYFKRAAP